MIPARKVTQHAYLFGGPEDGAIVALPNASADTVRLEVRQVEPAEDGTVIVLRRYGFRYRATGDVWTDRVLGEVENYVYEGQAAQ